MTVWKDDDEDEEVSPMKALQGTNLMDETGSPRKPQTKKQKTTNVAEAIKEVGEAQRAYAHHTKIVGINTFLTTSVYPM